MLKRTVLHLIILASCCLALTSIASAQWTVFDPTVYGETVDNYYQMVQSNATLLSQLQQAQQQYQTMLNQLTSLNQFASHYQLLNSWTQPSAAFSSPQDPFGDLTFWTRALTQGTWVFAPVAVSQATLGAVPPDTSSLDYTTAKQLQILTTNASLQRAALTDSLRTLAQSKPDTDNRSQVLNQLQADTMDTSELTQTQLAQKTELADLMTAQGVQDTTKMQASTVQLLQTLVQTQYNNTAAQLTDVNQYQQTAAAGTFSSLITGTSNTPGESYLTALTPAAVAPATN